MAISETKGRVESYPYPNAGLWIMLDHPEAPLVHHLTIDQKTLRVLFSQKTPSVFPFPEQYISNKIKYEINTTTTHTALVQRD